MNTNTTTLAPELLRKLDAYWRAANYLSVGQIYLFDNPLLKRLLALADVKHMLLRHWGTTPDPICGMTVGTIPRLLLNWSRLCGTPAAKKGGAR